VTSSIDIVSESEVSQSDRTFVRQWSKIYFGEDVAEHGMVEARVDWRLFLRHNGQAVGHVALTDLVVEIDGQKQILGAVGGLFTIIGFEGRGFANKVMDAVELFAYETQGRALSILFCLEELVPFYRRRGWQLAGWMSGFVLN